MDTVRRFNTCSLRYTPVKQVRVEEEISEVKSQYKVALDIRALNERMVAGKTKASEIQSLEVTGINELVNALDEEPGNFFSYYPKIYLISPILSSRFERNNIKDHLNSKLIQFIRRILQQLIYLFYIFPSSLYSQ